MTETASEIATPASLAGEPIGNYYHVCAFFDSREEEYSVLAPFFKEGLDRGEKCVHIVDPAGIGEHLQRLQTHGIDTDGCCQRGQLDVLSWDDAYLDGGSFDQDRMLGAINAVVSAGREGGYPRMRIMGNMGWTLKGNPGTEQVLEFEARVNDVLTESRQLAVCVYDSSKMSGAMMIDILRSHPLTLVGKVLHQNPFYVPPRQLAEELRHRREKSARAACT
jgi:MEDS: MEthanogen/methylotroph, DcmR Sensory domain